MTKHAILGRWAVAALFFINGFNMGAWAPQIPQMMERHGLKSGVMSAMPAHWRSTLKLPMKGKSSSMCIIKSSLNSSVERVEYKG